MRVEITDQQQRAVDEDLVRRAAEAAQRVAGGNMDELSVVLLDDVAMAVLNRRLLGRDETTDVIAFEAEQDPDALRSEIYVNTDAAARQGPEYGHDFVWELCFLVAHGVLHALGYDDNTEEERERMFALQEEALSNLGLGEDSKSGA
ncbi:MAG: rRNA maturation RNase YbeY [Armatimonadota bacterium]